MDKQHLRLILNGKSAGRNDVRAAVQAVRAMGHEVSVRVTFEAGDTARLAKEALRDQAQDKIDTLVSGGGDGTIHEVVDAVLHGLGLPDLEGGIRCRASQGIPRERGRVEELLRAIVMVESVIDVLRRERGTHGQETARNAFGQAK